MPARRGSFFVLAVSACALALVGACSVAAQPRSSEALRAVEALEGLEVSGLSDAAKATLAEVFSDEFDYCGRPLTLLAALQKGDVCAHTRRLARLAVSLAREGVPAIELVNGLGRYQATFEQPRATLSPDARQCQGPLDAKVTLVEFSDFECPACGAARPVLDDFAKRAKVPVRWCSMLFPLSAHQYSSLAGSAALIARDAGKFWPMHDALFENQFALSEATVRDLAKKVGLDAKVFDKALAAATHAAELRASKEAGQRAGVTATPTLFLNGRKLALPASLSYELLVLMHEDELDWIAGHHAWTSPRP